MGRDKRNENRVEHFTKMVRPMMETDAWRALSSSAQSLYVWVRMEWRGERNNNNGKLRLSVRQAAQKMGVSTNTVTRAFHDLQAKGFVFVTEHPRLGIDGEAKGAAYELTEIQMPNATGHGGRKLYREWKKGSDFPVYIAPANNPHGRRGKTETRLQNEDSTVVILKTKQKIPSSK